MAGRTNERVAALLVVALSLGALALLRGTAHVDEHYAHEMASHRHRPHLRHLGFFHPARHGEPLSSLAEGEVPPSLAAAAASAPPAAPPPLVAAPAPMTAEPAAADPAARAAEGPPGGGLLLLRRGAGREDAKARIKRELHEERKRQRADAAVAEANVIAARKVAELSQRFKQAKRGPGGAKPMFKTTGSSALGGKEARLAALAHLEATRIASVEAYDAVVEREAPRLRGFGFKHANETHWGPGDTGAARDDDSECAGQCGRNGFCRQGRCVCVAVFQGKRCEQPRTLPEGMQAEFTGSYLFNRARLRDLPDMMVRYTTNPKAAGGTHSFAVPVTEDMIRLAPSHDPLGKRVYERCAVVGSSGVMNHYRFGPEIDGANLVVRFNLAPTKGFSPAVGRRTSLRFVNTVHAGFHEGNELGIMQMQSQVGVQLYLKFRRDHPNERLVAFDPDFSAFVSKNVRTLPTGGYFAVWLALTRCHKVDLYGFNFRPGFGVPHHYFNEEKPRKGKVAIHNYDLEHALIVKLGAAGFIRFSEPCVAGCTEETGIRYRHLAPGARCQCGTGNPLPVAAPGFCRPRDSHMCFAKCPGGEAQCPGGLHLKDREPGDKTREPGPVDGKLGDCPDAVVRAHARMDPQGTPVHVKCVADADDLEGGYAAGRDTGKK